MSGSVSLVNGHIDPIEKGMTPQDALAFFKGELKDGKCSDYCLQCNSMEMAISALEKQIPKKPIENKYKGVQADYILLACPDCKQEFQFLEDITGNCNEQEQPFYCPDCGQALDWSDTE